MKTTLDRRLFWFLKEGVELDLDRQSDRDLYVQQVLTRGSAADVKQMLSLVGRPAVRDSLRRLARFLPQEVRRFWENAFGDIDGYSRDSA